MSDIQTLQSKITELQLLGRLYRCSIDETRSNPVSRVKAEYLEQRSGDWRVVQNWNTRERLYELHRAKQPACSQLVAPTRRINLGASEGDGVSGCETLAMFSPESMSINLLRDVEG